jgi:hypothetical protein
MAPPKMGDVSAMKVTVGDKVRVHYHPPGQRMSFIEGVVSRVDVTTRRGRVFVVDVTTDVILGREHSVRPGYQHYVLYERSDEFAGRIEMLSRAHHRSEPEVIPEPRLAVEPALDPKPEAADQGPDGEPAPEPEPAKDQGSPGLGSVLGSLFGRRT